MSGKYEMKLNPAAREMYVQIEGSFTDQQAKDFIFDYNKNVSKIQPGNFTLRLDSKGLRVVPQDMIPALEQCFVLYKQSNFKGVVVELKSGATIRMQMTRIAKRVGLTNLSIEQA